VPASAGPQGLACPEHEENQQRHHELQRSILESAVRATHPLARRDISWERIGDVPASTWHAWLQRDGADESKLAFGSSQKELI
jgi:hypothetical protein